jgi:hypothetical protein
VAQGLNTHAKTEKRESAWWNSEVPLFCETKKKLTSPFLPKRGIKVKMETPAISPPPLPAPAPTSSTWTTKQKIGLGVGIAIAVIVAIVLLVVFVAPAAEEETVARSVLNNFCTLQLYNGVDALQPIHELGWRTLAPFFKLRLSSFHSDFRPLTAAEQEAGVAPRTLTLRCYWKEPTGRTPLRWQAPFASTADATVSQPVPTSQTMWEPVIELPSPVDPTFDSQLVLEAVGNSGVVTSEPLRLSRLMADVSLSIDQAWTVDKSTYEVDIHLDPDLISADLMADLQFQIKLVPMSLLQSLESGATPDSLDAAADATVLDDFSATFVDRTVSIRWSPTHTKAPFATWTTDQFGSYYVLIKTLNFLTLTDWNMGREFLHLSPSAYLFRKTSATTIVMGSAVAVDLGTNSLSVTGVVLDAFATLNFPAQVFPAVSSGNTFTFQIISTTGLNTTTVPPITTTLPDSHFVYTFTCQNVNVVVQTPVITTRTLSDTRVETTRAYTARLDRINILMATGTDLALTFHGTTITRNITELPPPYPTLTLQTALPAAFRTMFTQLTPPMTRLELGEAVFTTTTGLTATAQYYTGTLAEIEQAIFEDLTDDIYTWRIQNSQGVAITTGYTHNPLIIGVTATPSVNNTHLITFGMRHTFTWTRPFSANESGFAMKVQYRSDLVSSSLTTMVTDPGVVVDQFYIAPSITFSQLQCSNILHPNLFTMLQWRYVTTGTQTYSDLSSAAVDMTVQIGSAAATPLAAADIALTNVLAVAGGEICTARVTVTPTGALSTLWASGAATDSCIFTLTLYPRGRTPAQVTPSLTTTFYWRRSTLSFQLTSIVPNGATNTPILIQHAGATISRPLQQGRYVSPGQIVGAHLTYAWSAVERNGKTLNDMLTSITPSLVPVSNVSAWTLAATASTLAELVTFVSSTAAATSREIRWRLYVPDTNSDFIYFVFALSRAAYAHISQQSAEQLFQFRFRVNVNGTGNTDTFWPDVPLIVCPSIHLDTPTTTSIRAYRDRIRITVSSTSGVRDLPGTGRAINLEYNDVTSYTASGQPITSTSFTECEAGVVLHTFEEKNPLRHTLVTTLPESGATFLSYRLNLIDIYRLVKHVTTNNVVDTRIVRVRCRTTGADGVNFVFPHPLDLLTNKTLVTLSYIASSLAIPSQPWFCNIPYANVGYDGATFQVGMRYALNRALDGHPTRLGWILPADRTPLLFTLDITLMRTVSSSQGRTPEVEARVTTGIPPLYIRSTSTGYELTADVNAAKIFTFSIQTAETPLVPIIQRTAVSGAISGQVAVNKTALPITEYATLAEARLAAQSYPQCIRIETLAGGKYRLSDNVQTPAVSTSATYHQIYKNMYAFSSDLSDTGYYPMHVSLDAMPYHYTSAGVNGIADIQITLTSSSDTQPVATSSTSLLSWNTLSHFMRNVVSGTGGISGDNVFSESTSFSSEHDRTALSTGDSVTYVHPTGGYYANPDAPTGFAITTIQPVLFVDQDSIYKPIIYNVDNGALFHSEIITDATGFNTSISYFAINSRVANKVVNTVDDTTADFYWQHVGNYDEPWVDKVNQVSEHERFWIFGRARANSTTVNDLYGMGGRLPLSGAGRCSPGYFNEGYSNTTDIHTTAMQVLSFTTRGVNAVDRPKAIWTTLAYEEPDRSKDVSGFVLPTDAVVRWGRTGRHKPKISVTQPTPGTSETDAWWVLKPTRAINRQPRAVRTWWGNQAHHNQSHWEKRIDPRIHNIATDGEVHNLLTEHWKRYTISFPIDQPTWWNYNRDRENYNGAPITGYYYDWSVGGMAPIYNDSAAQAWVQNVLQFLGKISSIMVANAQMEQREVGPIYERRHTFLLRHKCPILRESPYYFSEVESRKLGKPATISAVYISLLKWPRYTYITLKIDGQVCRLTPICYTTTPPQDKVIRCMLPLENTNTNDIINGLDTTCIPKPRHYTLPADPLTELTTSTDTLAKRMSSPLSHGVLGFKIFRDDFSTFTVNHDRTFKAEITMDAVASNDVKLIGVRTTTSAPKAHMLCACFELTYADYTLADVMV